MKPTLLVLAAGIGSRFGGIKQIKPVGPSGESLIDYSVYDALQAGYGKIVFVINKRIEKDFKKTFGNKYENHIQVEYVLQKINMVPDNANITPSREKPWGTGHAMLAARDVIHEPFTVINADDFYGKEPFVIMQRELSKLPSKSKGTYFMVGFQLKDTVSSHGPVCRGTCEIDSYQYLTNIVERTKIEKRDNLIQYLEEGKWYTLDPKTVVSLNFWGFSPDIFNHSEQLFVKFIENYGTDLKAEFYLPSIAMNTISHRESKIKVLLSSSKWFGVTYAEDLECVQNSIKTLVKEGTYPKNLWAD